MCERERECVCVREGERMCVCVREREKIVLKILHLIFSVYLPFLIMKLTSGVGEREPAIPINEAYIRNGERE